MAGKRDPRCDSERRHSGSGHRRKKWGEKKKMDKPGEGERMGREFYTAPDSVKQILPTFFSKGFITKWRETRHSGEDDDDGIDFWIFLPIGLAIPLQVLRKFYSQDERELINDHLQKHSHITRVIVLSRDELIPILDRGDGEKEKRTTTLIHKLCKIFWPDDSLRCENFLKSESPTS